MIHPSSQMNKQMLVLMKIHKIVLLFIPNVIIKVKVCQYVNHLKKWSILIIIYFIRDFNYGIKSIYVPDGL